MTAGLPVMKNVLTPLAKSVLVTELITAALATNEFSDRGRLH